MRTRAQARALTVLVALAVAASSCKKDEDEQFAGIYSGDGVDSQDRSNRKEFTLTVADSGTAVAGTYRIRAIILDVSGTVSGTLTGSQVALVLTPSAGDCPYRVSGTWTGNRITGTYAAFNCFVRSDGTLDLEKQ